MHAHVRKKYHAVGDQCTSGTCLVIGNKNNVSRKLLAVMLGTSV